MEVVVLCMGVVVVDAEVVIEVGVEIAVGWGKM